MLLIVLFHFMLASSPEKHLAYKKKYGIDVLTQKDQYQQHISKHPEMALVDLAKTIPSIAIDLRYASKNNFTKKKLYTHARAFVVQAMIDSLRNIQNALNKEGLGLKIYDAYRPYSITLKLYEAYKNPTFVSPPHKGSRHNRACALDLTLIDFKTKKELMMPTAFDVFSKKARYNALLTNATATKNRDLLINTMQKHGFQVTNSEWWHFDFNGYKAYPLLDIDFKDL